MMKLITLFENLVFPPKCACCGNFLDVDITKKVVSPLCVSCRAEYEMEKSYECPTCGLGMSFCSCMPKLMERAQCTCLLKLVAYKQDRKKESISNFIHSVKYIRNRDTISFFAEQMRGLLITYMRAEGLMPDNCVITYLPRSRQNLNEEGFDQSLILAKELSKITGIKFVSCFKRKYFTPEQKSLSRVERRLNMNSAYTERDVGDEIADKTVILVDDIVTTGSSMAACTRLLYSMGAYAVMGICLGRTERKNKK